MDLQDYINARLAKPMGWGAWGYCLHRDGFTMPHANGAGSIAVHATDALRFGYCLLRCGKWGEEQLVPAESSIESTTPAAEAIPSETPPANVVSSESAAHHQTEQSPATKPAMDMLARLLRGESARSDES